MNAKEAKAAMQQAWTNYVQSRAAWKLAIQQEAIETAEDQGFIIGDLYDWGTDRPVKLTAISRYVRADGFIGSIQLTLRVQDGHNATLFLDDIKLEGNQIVLQKSTNKEN